MSCSAVLDPAEIGGAGIGRAFDPLQQIRHALFEMGEGRSVVVADRHAVEAVGQAPAARLRDVRCGRRRPAARGFPASRSAPRCAVRGLAKESLLPSLRARWSTFDDSVCTSSDKPRQRVVGRHIGDDGAKRRDGAFELLHRGGVVIGAQDQVELAAEIADRLVIAGELFAGRQRVQRLREFRAARVRCRPAPGRRCRSGGCRRCGATASGFRSRSIRSRGAASPR